MAFFAGYGFNKAHSAAYGIICYQTAYLKANYTVEYMAALMSCAMGNTDKLVEYIEECRQLGIEVLPPDINESGLDFEVAGKDIRFGLGAIKGAGEKAILHIIETRERLGRFDSIHRFCEEIDSRSADRKVVEQLVRCGAFDSTGGHRAQLMEAVEQALRQGAVRQADRRAGQLSICASLEKAEGPEPLPDTPEWPQETLLAHEKEALGCYVSTNPLVRYEPILKSLSSTSVDRIQEMQDGAKVTIGGMISNLKALVVKSRKNQGNKFVTFKFADLTGSCEAVCFATEFEKNRDNLVNDAIVFVTARVGFRDSNANLRVADVVPMEQARESLSGSVRLSVSSAGLEEDLLLEVQNVLKAHPGECPVFFAIETPGGKKVVVQSSNTHYVSPSEHFFADIEEVLGTGHVQLSGKPQK